MASNNRPADLETDAISASSGAAAEKKVEMPNDEETAPSREPAPSYSQEDGVEIDYKTLEWWYVDLASAKPWAFCMLTYRRNTGKLQWS
jgi:hypothetical protein